MATNYRGMIPGTFTMGNVVCGFVAILSAIDGKILTGAWFIILAGFLDVLDGKVARLSGGSSQFGVELDSLADFLSFGVAPAVLVYSLKLPTLGDLGWLIISAVYIIAAAYRLARYNLLAETDEKKDFLGLPVPAAAMLLITFIIFCYEVFGQIEYAEWLVSMIVMAALLMVSQVEYESLPDRFDNRKAFIRLVVIIIAALVALWQPRLFLFPIVALYILLGMIREFHRLFTAGARKVAGRNGVESHNREEKQD